MRRLYYSIIILIAFWSVFFNIDRIIQFSGVGIFELHPFIYILLPIVTISVIFIPFFQRRSTLFLFSLGTLIYIITLLIYKSRYSSLDYNFPLLFMELVLLLISIFLAGQLNRHYINLKDLLEKDILPEYGYRVYNDRDTARRIIEHEFIRSRRNNHNITAVVFEANTGEAKDSFIMEQTLLDIQQTIKDQYFANKLMQVIENETRLTDLIVEWEKQKRIVVILPETNAETTAKLIDRLQNAVKSNLGVSINYGIASFPNDGPTFDAVLEKAEEQLTSPDNLLIQLTEYDDKTGSPRF